MIKIMIIDAFTFFNEKELVELRIKYLNELIDLKMGSHLSHEKLDLFFYE